ncbi:MAG: hypothetical protein KKB30_16325 [Proteobacteria bacterium]|nr:hypothetical protein [Pseudomonadota bacterium]MBU1715679.1 hypothetical protein [Pseudomonadota bacterium]
MTTANTKTRANINTSTAATTESAVNVAAKGTFAVAGTAAAIIGLWAAACFVGAMAGTGPIGLIKSWFAAIGM